jgi:hypothetical protein
MRKFILLSSFTFLVSAGYSQFVVFGAKAGLNLATFTGNAVTGTSLLPSFHVGGTANFLINENFMVQPEILYSGKGAKYDGGKLKFGYIEVPVLVQYKTASGFFIETGPQIGFLLNAKLNSQDWKDNVKSTDYSWVGGLGYKSAIGLGGSVRYDFGFFNVSNAGIIRNKTIMIGLFYTFGSSSEE